MKKCRCGKPGIYVRPLDKQSYCSRCLVRLVERNFKRNVRKYSLLDKKIAIVLDGGLESAVLMHLIYNLMKHGKDDILPIIVDKDNQKIKELYKKLGLKSYSVSKNMVNNKARSLGANKLCIAHSLEDEAQFILMNFLSGNMKAFIKINRSNEVKPLRTLYKKEIELYAGIKSIPYISKHITKDDVQSAINDLEKRYPGVEQQIIKFYDSLNH